MPNDLELDPSTMFDAWTEFRRIFAHAGATPAMLEALRNAFYCGGAAALAMVYDATTQADGVTRIDRLMAELHAFRYDIGRPR